MLTPLESAALALRDAARTMWVDPRSDERRETGDFPELEPYEAAMVAFLDACDEVAPAVQATEDEEDLEGQDPGGAA